MADEPGVGIGEGVGTGDASGAYASGGPVVDIWVFLSKLQSSTCLM